MKKILFCSLLLLCLAPMALYAQSDGEKSTVISKMTVTGHGEVMAAPDQVVIRLGILSQAKQAADAQQQASQVIAAALDKFKQMNIPDEKISTVGLTLSPVFSRQNPKMVEEPFEPIIVAYRARNAIQIVSDDINSVGKIIDAGVSAGANQLEGISFDLKDDLQYREQALRLAVAEARKKADTIAAAMGVAILTVIEANEGGINVFRPTMQVARSLAADTATPVQPGQLTIQASVTISYRITEHDKTFGAEKACAQ